MRKLFYKITMDAEGSIVTMLIDPDFEPGLEVTKNGRLINKGPTYLTLKKIDNLILKDHGVIEFDSSGMSFTSHGCVVGDTKHDNIAREYLLWQDHLRNKAKAVTIDELETKIFRHLIK